MRILIASEQPSFSQLLERVLFRFNYEIVNVDNGFDAFQKLITVKFDLLLMNYFLPQMPAHEVLRRCVAMENFKLPPVIFFISNELERRKIEGEHFPHTSIISKPFDIRRFVTAVHQALQQTLRVSCLGGGTGLFTLLSGLKTLPNLVLSSIVSMSDDGGSTGRLRDIFGILPPGDVRRSLVALSTAPDLMNQLIQYRFEKGPGLSGHNLGNLLLTALHEMRGSMHEAVKSLGEIMNIQGQVIPVTETVNTLHAEFDNGQVVAGESRIGFFDNVKDKTRIRKIWQEPRTVANPDALEAIFNSKYIILGPGDLYTSILSNLIVEGVTDVIATSTAKKIYICNVMTKPGETHDYQVNDHISEMIKYMGQDVLDYVVCSSTQFTEEALKQYALQNQYPVVAKDLTQLKALTRAAVIFADVASEQVLVRHDSLKLANVLKKIFDSAS